MGSRITIEVEPEWVSILSGVDKAWKSLGDDNPFHVALVALRDRIKAALPPEEPTKRGAVVQAGDTLWLRDDTERFAWLSAAEGDSWDWDYVTRDGGPVRVLFEGVDE